MAYSTAYVSRYCPQLLESGAWEFQEAIRMAVANDPAWDRDRADRGWMTVAAVCGADHSKLPTEFAAFIRNQRIPEETKTNVVRYIGQRMLAWPLKWNPPWRLVDRVTSAFIITAAQDILKGIRPIVQSGAVDAARCDLLLPGFVAALRCAYPELGGIIPGVQLTWLRCDIIYFDFAGPPPDGLYKALLSWFPSAGSRKCTAINLKHTIEITWPGYGVVLAIGLDCDWLPEFIAAYNARPDAPPDTPPCPIPSAFIIIAIDRRYA